ncbi:glutaminase domain-containing protein [Lacticaseibacillus kribbianus]|uniref:glutaminase domain-containing protein n=1 Tax=Lacticaseibacillus kribbianus TaxID=2926292 RepID=UPI001CD5DE21|nr:DUF4965 domain-containing protein [Lacticaseibacillus kribbianus]
MTYNRIPAVPLIVHDPYFSVWSPADHLTDADTRSWTDKPQPIRGTLTLDGSTYRVLGTGDLPALPQTGLTIEPTQTIAVFETASIALTLTFSQHFDLSDLETISEPITYLTASLVAKDGAEHAAKLSLQFPASLTYETLTDNRVVAKSFDLDHATAVSLGKARQTPLDHSGDLIDIDWGYLYLAAAKDQGVSVAPFATWNKQGLEATLTLDGATSQTLLIAYDDGQAINYFGTVQGAYWKHQHKSMLSLLDQRVQDAAGLVADCGRLNEQIDQQAIAVGGEDYRLIAATAYRQSIAAHKLIQDEHGELIFLSKECNSNGCIGTVDVSYPSIPLFLAFAPELVLAMCRPIMRFAATDVWTYDFAPHDVGRYPYATGQVYGLNNHPDVDDGTWIAGTDTIPVFADYPANADLYTEKYQMPVEECGDMILMASLASLLTDSDFVVQHHDRLVQWSQFLLTHGQDPANQLCTDDFAGHLAHNVNLSLKAIVALGALGKAFGHFGFEAEGATLLAKAHEMAAIWQDTAASETDSRLAFDQPESWSLKYNMVWDEILGLDLFPAAVRQREVTRYLKEQNGFGTPLDLRADYTKTDWLLWAATLTDDPAEFAAMIKPVARFLGETETREPFSDWYDTKTGRMVAFKNRSVIGGVFMPYLKALAPFQA